MLTTSAEGYFQAMSLVFTLSRESWGATVSDLHCPGTGCSAYTELNGAKLSVQSRLVVPIQPMGRGMTKLLEGLEGRPEVSPLGCW